MKIELEFEENEIIWENNAYMKIVQPSKTLLEIQANKEGLISLAKQLVSLANSTEKDFDHIHYWAERKKENMYLYGDLAEGSLELSIAKVNNKGKTTI